MFTSFNRLVLWGMLLTSLFYGPATAIATEYQVWDEWHNSLLPEPGTGNELTLASNGTTNYRIVMPALANDRDIKAASMLQYWLEAITGVILPIVNEGTPLADDYIISIGQTVLLEQSGLPATSVDLGDEGYGIATQGNTLFLWGGRTRGAINATIALLEEDIGCRWYTTTYDRAPNVSVLTLTPVDRTYAPPLRMRDPYYKVAFNKTWSLWNRTNAHEAAVPEKWGGHIDYDGLFSHSFRILLPPKQYFDTHPEYFIMDDYGNRIPYSLCTTNPDVCELVATKVLQRLANNPNTEFISVAKDDGESCCLCPTCKALDDAEGSVMASLLYLVNYVAEAIEQNYPDVLISTLAYSETINLPKTVRPRENVVIRVCNAVDGAWEQPFIPMEQTHLGTIFEAWSAAHNPLSVWTYTTNFRHYLAPMPNMAVISDDIRYLIAKNVSGIQTQGAWQSSGERDWMRAWVIAKMLWDPSRNWYELMQDFIWGHYGEAAPAIAEYNELLRYQSELYADQLRRPPYGIYFPMTIVYLNKDFLNTASAIFDRAEALAEDEEVLQRVERQRLSIMYVKLERGPEFTGIEYRDILTRFETIARREGVTYVYEATAPNLDAKLQEWQVKWDNYIQGQQWTAVLDMGAVDDEEGLKQVSAGDGNTTPVSLGGRDARRNWNRRSDRYFYFDADDRLIYQGNLPEIYITVDYFDTGTGSLTLQYDSNIGSEPADIYKDGGSITLAGSNTWRQHVFAITDAYFGNRQTGNADFRICGNAEQYFYLDIVQISEVHQLPKIGLSKTSFNRKAVVGNHLSCDTFTVSNSGDGILSYCLNENANWLSITPRAGMNTGEPDTIHITYNTASLPVGEYEAVIELESSHADQSSKTVTVNLSIYTPGDFDSDGDVDLEDFARFQVCLSGPENMQFDPACDPARLIGSYWYVDQEDLAVFQTCMSGANIPANPNQTDLPMVTTAESVKTHGMAGDFSINVLDRTDNCDIECRQGGLTKLVVGFNMDIQRTSNTTADVEISSGGPNPDVVTQSASNELTIQMSGTTDGEPLTVTFPGIARADDVSAACADSICIRQLFGDVNSDLSVDSIDQSDVRGWISTAVGSSNFRADIRVDGSFNAIDRVNVRDAVDKTFSGTCP